jgi:hypothetical protein
MIEIIQIAPKISDIRRYFRYLNKESKIRAMYIGK